MKKTISVLILIFCLLLALTACGGDTKPSGDPAQPGASVSSDEPGTDTPSEKVDPNAPITEKLLRSHAAAPAEDFTYDVEENGIKIKSYAGSDTVVVIPAEIEGKPVTALYNYVFGNNSPVRAVLIPESVKEIEEVFINNETVELVICEGATRTLGLTFGFCSNLQQVIFGKDLQELGGIGTFGNCTKLKELHFTQTLTNIDDELVFEGCENLTIYAPAGSYAESFANENNIPFQAE